MKESEAKTKWCPQARAIQGSYVYNRTDGGKPQQSCMCIGSACMLWRWDKVDKGMMTAIEISDIEGRCGLSENP